MDGVWTSASRKRGSLGTRALLLPESTKARPRTSIRGLAPPQQMPARGRARRRRGRGPASRRSGASTPDACGALKSRARPRSSPPGTPRRQAPAREHPRRRRFSRLCLGLGALRHRDKGVEVGAVDVVRRAHQCGLDDLRRRGAPPRPRRLPIREAPPRSWVPYVSVTKAHNTEPVMQWDAPTETGLGDVRTRCVDGVERARERAPSTAWGLAAMLSTRASASARDGLCRAAPTAP